MNLRWFVTPTIFTWLFPDLLWSKNNQESAIYLTFDDGPTPETTPEILALLEKYGAKATFFCVGDNLTKHPGMHKKMLDAGHAVANHSYHHLNGWKTPLSEYQNDVRQCQSLLDAPSEKPLFRPPYGKMSWSQYRWLVKNYQVVMWGVLTYDFDPRVGAQESWQRIHTHIVSGSIVLLHDRLLNLEKTMQLLVYILDRCQKNKLACQRL